MAESNLRDKEIKV